MTWRIYCAHTNETGQLKNQFNPLVWDHFHCTSLPGAQGTILHL